MVLAGAGLTIAMGLGVFCLPLGLLVLLLLVLTYLTGELWRRAGDLSQAYQWFNRVPSELSDPATQQWVVDAARQQRDCPREWFG